MGCPLGAPCAADVTASALSGGSAWITGPLSEEEVHKRKTVGPPLQHVLLEWVRKRPPDQTAGSSLLPGSHSQS